MNSPMPTADFRTPPLRRRMAAWLYEGVLLFGLVFAAGLIFSVATQMRHALQHRHALQIFLFIVFGAYFILCWKRGGTLAMQTWHIRLTDKAGNPVGYGRAFWRYILCWIWFLPPLIAVYIMHWKGAETAVLCTGWVMIWALSSRLHPQRQFWHDILAGTRLIDTRTP